MKLSNVKSLLLSTLFASSICASVQALPLPSAPVLVSVPDFEGGYELSASLLFLQPTSSSLDYAILTSPFPVPTPNWQIQALKPDYRVAFNIALGYVTPHSANNYELNWTHAHSRDAKSVSADPTQFVGPYYEIGPAAGTLNEAEGNTKFQYDLVNLDVGQFVDFGKRFQTRFFAGANFLSLKQHLNVGFRTGDPAFNSVSENISEFKGVGPRLGIASTYDLGCGFGLIGHIAGTTSIGRMKSSMNFISTSAVLNGLGIGSNPQAISSDNVTQIVPGSDAKLGFTFFYPFAKDYRIDLEAGYQVAAYMNAIKEVYPTSLVAPFQTGTVAVATMGESASNFGIGGVYLKLAVDL